MHVIGGAGSALTVKVDGEPIVSGEMPAEGYPTLFITDDGVTARSELLDETRNDETVGTKVSPKVISREIDNLISNLFFREDTRQPVLEEVRSFVQMLRGKVKPTIVYLAVENLFLKDLHCITFGEVELIIMDHALPEIAENAWNVLDGSSHTPEEKRNLKVRITGIILNSYQKHPTCAKITVDSERSHSDELAQERIEATLNVLRCYTHLLFRRDLRPYFGLVGAVRRFNRQAFSFSEGGFEYGMAAQGALDRFVVEPSTVEHLRQHCALDILGSILATPHKARTRLQQAIFTAAQWIGSGIIEPEPIQQVLHFTIAIEGLVHGQKGEGIADAVASRVAHLLSPMVSDTRQLYRDAKRLYSLRSSIAHTGVGAVDPDDVAMLEWVAVHCLIAMAERSHEWKSQDELVAWVEVQVFGGRAVGLSRDGKTITDSETRSN